MEDCNMLVSDCIVVSCCCQCLILQLIVFIFLHLPRKLARKARDYTKKRLARRRKKSKKSKEEKSSIPRHKHEFVGLDDGRSMSTRILELEAIALNKLHRWGSCSNEVDKVLGELSLKGEFAFGSFWGYNDQENVGLCSKCCRTMTQQQVLDFSGNHVKFHFIEVLGPDFGPS